MRLFDEPEAHTTRSGADWEHHRRARQPQVGPAQDEVGVLALSSFALARSADVAVAVRGITAHSDGLLLHVTVLFADEQRREQIDWSLQEYGRSPGRFRFGVELPSGARALTGTSDSPALDHPDRPATLTLQGSTIGALQWQGDYWLHPLPDEGTMVVGCWWPDRGIEESLVAVDTEPLLAAAASIKPVWLA